MSIACVFVCDCVDVVCMAYVQIIMFYLERIPIVGAVLVVTSPPPISSIRLLPYTNPCPVIKIVVILLPSMEGGGY